MLLLVLVLMLVSLLASVRVLVRVLGLVLLIGGRVGVMVRISVMVTGTSALGLVLGVPPACLSSQPARELSPLADIYQRDYD